MAVTRSKEWQRKENSRDKNRQKRKLEQQSEERESAIVASEALQREVTTQVDILKANYSWTEADRAAAKRATAKCATHLLVEFAKYGTNLPPLFSVSILTVNGNKFEGSFLRFPTFKLIFLCNHGEMRERRGNVKFTGNSNWG